MTDLIRRGSAITPASFNADERTFDAILTSGAPVIRQDGRGQFVERLDLSALDPQSLIGLPVLDGHRQSGSEFAVGTVIAAWREGDNIAGTVRLSAAADVASVVTKVGEGTLRGVSIGYSAAARRETGNPATGQRTVTITPRIHEISIVAIPADPEAVIRMESPPMTTETQNSPPANDNVEYRQQVRAIARAAGQSPEWADQQIDAATDIVAVRAAAFEVMTTRTQPIIRTNAPANDDPAVILARRADALFARVNGSAPDDAARQYFGETLLDHARAAVVASGQSITGMDREQIFRAAMHTTSDFPNLLTSTGSRILMPAYQAAQSPLKAALARQALATDFRAMSRLKLGNMGTLQKVAETGEIKSSTMGEAAETYAIDTYGSLFALSRKAMINDDLGAFRDWGVAAGRAAAETEAQLLFAMLTQSNGAGPIMGEDGKRLFHADHGNLAASGTGLDTDNLSAARKAMRTQKNLDGKTPIAVTPRYLLVGPELETTAETVVAAITPANQSDVNPFAGKLDVLVEPRLGDKSWYVFADPVQLAVLEYAYLSSAQGPQMASREGWDVLGMEFRVTLDFGCDAVDFRGAYRNPGL